MPFRMGPAEIALIVFIVLIVFGVGKLPQIGGAIGKGIREFRKAQQDDYDEEKSPKQPRATTLTSGPRNEKTGRLPSEK